MYCVESHQPSANLFTLHCWQQTEGPLEYHTLNGCFQPELGDRIVMTQGVARIAFKKFVPGKWGRAEG